MYGGCSLRLYKHVTDAPTGKHRSTKINTCLMDSILKILTLKRMREEHDVLHALLWSQKICLFIGETSSIGGTQYLIVCAKPTVEFQKKLRNLIFYIYSWFISGGSNYLSFVFLCKDLQKPNT
jgi:hypothetical protein